MTWLRFPIGMWPQREVGTNSVGIRELRDGLSRAPRERLIAEGLVQPAKKRKGALPEPVRIRGAVSDLVAEQRG